MARPLYGYTVIPDTHSYDSVFNVFDDPCCDVDCSECFGHIPCNPDACVLCDCDSAQECFAACLEQHSPACDGCDPDCPAHARDNAIRVPNTVPDQDPLRYAAAAA